MNYHEKPTSQNGLPSRDELPSGNELPSRIELRSRNGSPGGAHAPARRPVSDGLLDLVAARIAVLADPMRLRLLQRLRLRRSTVAELTDTLPTTQQNVSRHLARLHDAGFVTRVRDGRCVRYAISSPTALRVLDLLAEDTVDRVDLLARSVHSGTEG